MRELLEGKDFKIDKKTNCYIWLRRLCGGYPKFNFEGKLVSVHRLLITQKLGLPYNYTEFDVNGKTIYFHAHHKCDNTKCINVDHLEFIPISLHRRKHFAQDNLDRILIKVFESAKVLLNEKN